MKRLIPLLLALLLSGCARDSTSHYARALAIEREVLRRDSQAGYGDRGYIHVLRELAAVPRGDADKARARALFQRISDGRRFALVEAMPQVDSLPRRLRGTEAPEPPRGDRARPDRSNPATAAAFAGLGPEAREKLDITLYSTTWCGYCKKARAFFDASGLPYVEKDIERDPAAQREYEAAANGYSGVPLIVVNGQALRGFSRPAVEQAIQKAVGG